MLLVIAVSVRAPEKLVKSTGELGKRAKAKRDLPVRELWPRKNAPPTWAKQTKRKSWWKPSVSCCEHKATMKRLRVKSLELSAGFVWMALTATNQYLYAGATGRSAGRGERRRYNFYRGSPLLLRFTGWSASFAFCPPTPSRPHRNPLSRNHSTLLRHPKISITPPHIIVRVYYALHGSLYYHNNTPKCNNRDCFSIP